MIRSRWHLPLLLGLLAVAAPLAEAGVSIFAVNSYETEYVLVQEPDLERARAALEQVGHLLA